MIRVAVIGRPNVGKSSLINKLVNRRHLVKTSSTPGRTQLINFFQVNQNLSLVDLPGYGFARVPKSVRKNWGPMIETYLTQRPSLLAVVLILDIRRTPDAQELNFIEWLSLHGRQVILVLTKSDKLSGNKRSVRLREILSVLNHGENEPILFSSKTGLGKEALWKAMEGVLPSPMAVGDRS